MAVDEALLRTVQSPLLRIYRWSEPAISIGYFDSWKDVPPDRPFVRRFTGGGLVDHARDFTYSIIVPRHHPLNQAGPQESYCLIHRAVADALASLGCAGELVEEPPEITSNACFQKPVKFDVVQGGQKIAGAAQRRTREGCLHQGSLLLPASLDFQELSRMILPSLLPLLAPQSEPSLLSIEEQARAEKLEEERYRTEAWNLSR
jgi:lipoate-protein ligase A